jgi:hypothetical protein
MRRVPHQVDRKPIRRTFQHTKSFSKHQIAHDVEDHPITPIRHVPLIVPSTVFLLTTISTIFLLPQQPTSRPNIRQDISLQSLDRTITKRMTQHPPLPGMHPLINTTMHIDRRFTRRKSGVEIRLSDIGAKPIDCFQGGGGVEGECVGPNAHDGAIAVVCAREG